MIKPYLSKSSKKRPQKPRKGSPFRSKKISRDQPRAWPPDVQSFTPMEDEELPVEDDKICPNCGGDLEDGDHTICSKW